MAAISQSNVNLSGSHCGVSIGKKDPHDVKSCLSQTGSATVNLCLCWFSMITKQVYHSAKWFSEQIRFCCMKGLLISWPIYWGIWRETPPPSDVTWLIAGEDGPSQMALEDLAMFRAIPTCTLFYPSDGVSTERAVELCANTKVCFPDNVFPISSVLMCLCSRPFASWLTTDTMCGRLLCLRFFP